MNSGEACEGERVLLGAEQGDGDPMTPARLARNLLADPVTRSRLVRHLRAALARLVHASTRYSAAGASRLVCALAAARRCAVTRPPTRAPARDRSAPSGVVGPVEAPP